MIPVYAPDPLAYAVIIAISGDSYSLDGNADDQTNCIRFLWEFSTVWRPELGRDLLYHKTVLHLYQEPLGSFAHLEMYEDIGACADATLTAGGFTVTPGADYFWQGWRASGTGHCGILRVPPAPDVGPSPKCVRIDARRDPPWVRETTYEELQEGYETFRLVRLLGRDGR